MKIAVAGTGLAAVSSSFFAALYSAFGRYDVVHIHDVPFKGESACTAPF